MTKQPGQAPNVLVVVADDLDDAARVPVAQVREVPRWDLPAAHVANAPEAEEIRLDRPKSRVGESMTEEGSNDRQEVEVPGELGRAAPVEPEARDEQRPVK